MKVKNRVLVFQARNLPNSKPWSMHVRMNGGAYLIDFSKLLIVPYLCHVLSQINSLKIVPCNCMCHILLFSVRPYVMQNAER